MIPPEKLVPQVRELADRLCFEVQSRSRSGRHHRVDLETRGGLGSCTCEMFTFGDGSDCRHLTLVSKYLRIKVAQAVMKYNQKSK